MRTITDCPCGSDHRISETMFHKLAEATKGKPPTVPVGNVRGCWRVPRVYIAMHGVQSERLPGLAEQYGWERL